MTVDSNPDPDPTPRWRWGDTTQPLVALLDRGGVLAIPTESSYGLAVSPRSQKGVDAVYRIKRRPTSKALLVVGARVGDLAPLGIDEQSPIIRFGQAHWPAPLTVISTLRADASPLPATGGLPSLAVRIPAHDQLRGLLASIGPVTATSANLAGQPPILAPAALDALLAGHDAMIVDDGALAGGPPSTLVREDAGRLEILRRGALELDALELGAPEVSNTTQPRRRHTIAPAMTPEPRNEPLR